MSASRPLPPEADIPSNATLRGSVLFVHGLWMSGAESFLLRRRLALLGWNLRVVRYSSLAESPEAIARRCARQAEQLAARTALPVHLLGHSLGGLIIHRMFELGLLAPDEYSGDFRRVIFLGTPAGGTRTGRTLASSRWGRRLLGVAGAAELLDARPRTWTFGAQLGLIAGDKPLGLGRLLNAMDEPNDGTVAVSETHLPGATAHRVLPVTHTGLWLSPEVVRECASFFEHGAFTAPGATRGG